MSKDKVILVTQNEHKLAELKPIFEEYDVPFETTNLQKYELPNDGIAREEKNDVTRQAIQRIKDYDNLRLGQNNP